MYKIKFILVNIAYTEQSAKLSCIWSLILVSHNSLIPLFFPTLYHWFYITFI